MAATEDAGGAQSAGPTPDSGTAAQQHPGDTLSMPTLSAAQIPAPSSDRDAEASCDTKEPVEKQIKFLQQRCASSSEIGLQAVQLSACAQRRSRNSDV